MNKTKKVTAFALVVCIMFSIISSFAYFTDRVDAKTTATAGSLAINLDDSGIKLTDNDGKDILNPGDVRDISYKVTNMGNKSMDVKETITLSVYDSIGQAIAVSGNATTQSEVDLYNSDDVTNYNTVDGYTLAEGATPITVKTINNNVITYNPELYTLNGNHSFNEQELETGIDTDAHTTDLKLVFDKAAANTYQGAVIKIDVLVEAKQHRNTSAYNDNWTELQTETYIFSNGAEASVVKAANAAIPEKLQLMTSAGVAKAFAASANMVIPAEIDGDTVTGIIDNAYKGETVIETVEIPASVETIGASAFENCTNLNTLTLNNGLKTIKTAAFKNTALSTVTIPSTVTNITNDVFDDETNIKFIKTTADVTIEVYINNIKNDTSTKIINKEIASTVSEKDAKTAITNFFPKYSEFVRSENTPLTVIDGNNIIKLYYNLDMNQYTIDKAKFKTLAEEKTGAITFSTTSLTEGTVGTDLSTKNDGSVIGIVDGENVTIYSKNGRTYAPTDSSKMFEINLLHGFKASSIDCSGLDTSNTTNMSSMFEYCSNLTNITFGDNFDTSNVTDMSNMFFCCSKLNNIDVSGFDTSKVTNISSMFGACENFTELNIDNFNTSNVTRINGMFYKCSKLTTLNVSSFDTSKVKEMQNMFSGCKALTKLNLSGFNTENVTDMAIMFNECSNLTSLDLSSFDTSKVTDMSSMFDNCSKLKNIVFGNKFDTSQVTDMCYMFSNCLALTELDLSDFNIEKVEDFEGIFDSCSGLTITVANKDDKAKIENSDFFPSTCKVVIK